MQIKKNSRQMPSAPSITREKDYCDLLYAWLQCHSERDSCDPENRRRIEKRTVNWCAIERDFTREVTDDDGNMTAEKVMTRKTIAKYFEHLKNKGLIVEDEKQKCYYLKNLDTHEANLIEYNTLTKLMNVFSKNSISIYIYLFNRYCANGYQPFVATHRQIKEFIGVATSTTSNNLIISDTIEILKRLGLLDTKIMIAEDHKTLVEVQWVKNELPKL